jgi:hypothetical protein
VYCVHPKVGHLGIFVSGAVARKEHAGFVELLDLIEALPPGLYEMLIEDKRPDMQGAQLVPDRYVTRFERRSLADVQTLVGDREGERPFEVVRRVSETNAELYEKFVAPIVQRVVTEPRAELLRQLHPLRAQRWAVSDLNPLMKPLASAASAVRADRRPCPSDNPFRALERTMAKAGERMLDAMADTRDKMAELTFQALYANPFARAVTGLANAAPSSALGADPARRELARREVQELIANGAGGTTRDGIVRLLLLMFNEQGAVDERTYRALQEVREALPNKDRVPPPEMREIARRQALLLRMDRDAAIQGLKTIFAAPEDRAFAVSVLQKAAEAVGAKIDGLAQGPMSVLLSPAEGRRTKGAASG